MPIHPKSFRLSSTCAMVTVLMCASLGSRMAHARYGSLSTEAAPSIEVNFDVIEQLKNTPVYTQAIPAVPEIPSVEMPLSPLQSEALPQAPLPPEPSVVKAPAPIVAEEPPLEVVPLPPPPSAPPILPDQPVAAIPATPVVTGKRPVEPEPVPASPIDDGAALPTPEVAEEQPAPVSPVVPPQEPKPLPEAVAVLPKPVVEPVPTPIPSLPEVAVAPAVEEPVLVETPPSLKVVEDNIQTLPWIAPAPSPMPDLPPPPVEQNTQEPAGTLPSEEFAAPVPVGEPPQPEALPAKPKRSLFAWLPFSGHRSKTAGEASTGTLSEAKQQDVPAEEPVAEGTPSPSAIAVIEEQPEPVPEASSPQSTQTTPDIADINVQQPAVVSELPEKPEKEAAIQLPEPDVSEKGAILEQNPPVPSVADTESKPQEKHSFFSELFGRHKKEPVSSEGDGVAASKPEIAVEEEVENLGTPTASSVNIPSIFREGSADDQFIVLKDNKSQKNKFTKKETLPKHKKNSTSTEPAKAVAPMTSEALPEVAASVEPDKLPASLPEAEMPVVETPKVPKPETIVSSSHTDIPEVPEDVPSAPPPVAVPDTSAPSSATEAAGSSPVMPDLPPVPPLEEEKDSAASPLPVPSTPVAEVVPPSSVPVPEEASKFSGSPEVPSSEPEPVPAEPVVSEAEPTDVPKQEIHQDAADATVSPSGASDAPKVPESGAGNSSVVHKVKSWFGTTSELTQTRIPSTVADASEVQQTHIPQDVTIATNDIGTAGIVAAQPAVVVSLPSEGSPSTAVPSAHSLERELHINFDGSEANISDEDKQLLSQMMTQQLMHTKKQVKITTYAKGIDGKAASAQRISLQRSIAIRSYLIQQGLEGSRIRVQALGDQGKGLDSATIAIE